MATARGPSSGKRNQRSDIPDSPRANDDTRPSGIQRSATAVQDDEAGADDGKGSASKWTTMDQFVHSGFCYQLRRRPIAPPGDNARLSKREELVVEQVVAGRSNKSIAYELGVSPSTVGVLLFRAATKLGVRSRSELAAVYARRKGRDEPSE